MGQRHDPDGHERDESRPARLLPHRIGCGDLVHPSQCTCDRGRSDALTVTGKTLAENLAEMSIPPLDGEVLRTLDNPIHETGGLTILLIFDVSSVDGVDQQCCEAPDLD